jgi:hypothetical protein
VPAIHGAKTTEIQNNVEKSYLNNSFYKKAFSLFKEQLRNDKKTPMASILNKLDSSVNGHLMDGLLDFSYSDFLQILEFLGSPDITKSMNLRMAIIEVIQIFRQMQNIVSYNGESYEINPQLVNLVDRFNSEVEPEPINNPSSDFDVYWDRYSNATAHWGNRFNSENFQEWFNDIDSHSEDMWRSSQVPLVVSLALSFLPVPAGILGWALLADILLQVFKFISYVLNGYNHYSNLIEAQVIIVIRVVENTTERNGIDGLWMESEGGIVAKSTDAISKCDGSRGKTMPLFTYLIGPAKGTNESGWYSLKNRDIPEGQVKDYKSPHPPGNWTIEINGNEQYNGSGIIPIYNIPLSGTKIIEIPLDPK